MDFSFLFSAPQPIPLHAFCALICIIVGGIQFLLSKGTFIHKFFGYIWILLMMIVCVSSFFIRRGGYSLIHILSIYTIFVLFFAIKYAQKGNIKAHQSCMINLYVFSLILAGILSFFPGRIMNKIFFSS